MITRDDFAALFPHSSRRFSDGAPDLFSWSRASEQGRRTLWHIYLEAEALLVYCASYRQPDDLFRKSRFWARLYNLMKEQNDMAGRKTKDAIPDTSKAEWKGFLDFRLTDGQLAALDEWKPKPADIWNSVDNLLSTGYRFTLSYNSRTKLASVTLIDDDPVRKTGGYALSSSDVDGALALKMALYKHEVLLEGDWAHIADVPAKPKRG